MLESLQQIDVEILVWINHTFKSDWMDAVMLFCSGKLTWIPWYAVLLFFLYKSSPKRIWVNLILIACCIALADQLASGFLKPWVARLRPCHNDSVNIKLILIDGVCGGQYGFVSSHAANVFSVFFFFVLKDVFQKMKCMIYILLVWAIIVSLSRVYLGVHYPGDVLWGALIGMLATWVIVWLEGIVERFFFKKQ
ncbi:MAG TPA: phosphatase PAP2 family protein [Cytophaga sp.]|jgi:undecaprenyl-diphosphatase|nr:phosphatase PAP2 family protein [Cytophaga sp.]